MLEKCNQSSKISETRQTQPGPPATATVSVPALLRRRVYVRGVVQGVGFRPFVYNLARKIGISGFILNSSSGVTIEVEGTKSDLHEFLEHLRLYPPPLAQIEQITSVDIEPIGETYFEIHQSETAEGEFVLVSPEVATCADCLSEVADPENRRFAYPFTNCTNCGPRYTIIRDIPYDRPMTTMAEFPMCSACGDEYYDPADRRFHAQPNACPDCGPTVLLAKSDSLLPPKTAYDTGTSARFVMSNVRKLLHAGDIIALKGLGGFQLACDAENDNAVRRLRRRKQRSDKPFALMAPDLAAVDEICFVSPADRQLLQSPQRPIVILPRRERTRLSSEIAPGNKTIGVMLAYSPLHSLLFGETPNPPPEFTALVMTSGNLSDEPIVISNEEARQRLASVADWFLFHNRDIYMRVDDSVARTFEARSQVLRRSRGYVPSPIDLGSPLTETLACGGELKNTFCLTKGTYAIVSQHIGDLENYETLKFFHETLANLKKLFRVSPKVVAHDLHPLYLSSRIARDLELPKIGVQHHHAHIASCMVENGIHDKVIGVALDGTGYGTDGRIWGGEFLVADFAGFERRAHLRYIPLPGGDAAVRQNWRPALSWLREAFGNELPADLPLFRDIPEREIAIVSRMLERNFNAVATSSCGRLFDAVASIIGVRQEVTFEAQAAIELEMATAPGIEDCYSFDIDSGVPAQIDMRSAIRDIVRDLKRDEKKSIIASRFHNTMAAVIAEVCSRVRRDDGLDRVCLSGGTFQNMYLLQRTVLLLRARGFEVFLHSKIPSNDGGISLGQAVIANQLFNCGA